MLYEVITGRGDTEENRNTVGRVVDRIRQNASVITSYSIHYTKLYDLQIARIGSQADPVAEMAAKYNIREAIGILIRINPNYPVKEEWASYVPIVDR